MNVLYITPAGGHDSTLAPLRQGLPALDWTIVSPEDELSAGTDAPPDLVVVSPETLNPLDLARPLREMRNAELLFLRHNSEREGLESKVSMMPGIAGRAQVSEASDTDRTVLTIRRIVETIESRRHLRTTLDRMNLRLVESFDPTQMRKMALSDEYLAAILSSAADAILSLDDSGVITSANDAAERMFGCGRSELLGKNFEYFVEDDDRDQFQAFSGNPEAARSDRLRLRFVREDESVRTADVTLSWFGDSGRVPRSISVIARDVSREEREAREKQLLADAGSVLFSSLEMRESLQRLASLLVEEWVEISMIDLLRGDVLHRASAGARGELGDRIESLLSGATETSEHPGADALRSQKVLLQKNVDPEFLEALDRDGENGAALSSAGIRSVIVAPLVVHGRSFGLLTVFSTGRELDNLDVRLAAELAQRTAIALDNARLYEDALEASRLKDEFLATLSHELRTPMTAILGWVRMLDLGDLDEETYREAMTTIRRSAKAQASLIDDILDVSRITLGKLRLDVKQVDPAELVRHAVETSKAAADAKRIELAVEFEPELPAIRGDGSRLQQVIWNLVSNAVKFTPKDGSIRVVSDSVDSWIRIRVSDSGEGIPEADVPYVFERFRQVDSSSTRQHGGLGLGLSIVKQIVEIHGGKVAAESEGPGKGATFTVLLPIAPFSEAIEEEVSSSGGFVESEEMELYSLEGQSILVVDDHDDSRRLIRTVLEQAGADVVPAGSAHEALELLESRSFSVVVSDIAMPDEDGFRLLERIRVLEKHRSHSMCMVALTAFGGELIEEKMRAAGFDAYLRKPVDPVVLTLTIHDLLELGRPGSVPVRG